jgi:pyridinium-3,5-bisthiocarboxylic acid mononucleotide nickel chelatase
VARKEAVTNVDENEPLQVSAVHLDAVGGIAGDMFSAALLDVRPDLWPACERAIAAVGLDDGTRVSLARYGDSMLSGSRFVVEAPWQVRPSDGRLCVHWSNMRERITSAHLDEGVRTTALAIFRALAKAEAAVHGVDMDGVAFHEVGADDSIADILSAAAIISGLGRCRWSIDPIPRGRGFVATEHGTLPVPAPATLELLKGFVLIDDGEQGERVTPTGAAILRHLAPSQEADTVPRRLIGAGIGFGTRMLETRSNVLRASLFGAADDGLQGDRVEVLRFEVDDQTGEDLAVALERLRGTADVVDVCQWPVLGKKGRMAAAIQVLVRPEAAERVVDEVFAETTTLGVRCSTVGRTTVRREMRDVDGVPVKLARRPAGTSAKAEMDGLAHIEGIASRQAERKRVEVEAIEKEASDG